MRFLAFAVLLGAATLEGTAAGAQGHPVDELRAAVQQLSGGTRSLAGLRALRRLESLGTLEQLGVDATRWSADPSGDQTTDSLYRMARRSLDRGDYRRAGELFTQVRNRDPRAPIAADALYWHAFAMFRIGGSTGLESALASLTTLASDYPRAAVAGDGRALRVRVCGALAAQGDARCAEEITALSTGAGASGGSGSSQGGAAGGSGGRESAQGQQQGCPDEDDDERVAALNALLQMDAERALPVLERTLARRDRCSVTLRRKAVFLVSQKRSTRSADILLNAVKTDPDGEVREQAVFWLGQLRDDRAVTILEDLLRTEKDADVLDKVVFALSQHKSERAATLLRDLALRDAAPRKLREQAIFWIGQQRSSENADLLIGLYSRVSDEELKDKIIFSLSQLRSAASDKWMMDLALNEREPVEMRKKALFWAGQNKSVNVAALAGLYDRMADREMKEQLIFVLGQRRDADAVTKMIDIAKSDKDRELRKRAMFWLGQSKDPRAIKFFEEIVNR